MSDLSATVAAGVANTSPQSLVNDITEVSPEWLTQVLRNCGKLGAAEVIDFDYRAIGVGQTSRVFEIVPRYSENEPMQLQRLVCKVPSLDAGSLDACAMANVYVTEVNFYNKLRPTLKINTPEIYFAEADPADNRRFVMLMEHMAPSVPGDTIAGCSFEQSCSAFTALAGLHGPRWGDPGLKGIHWLRDRRQNLANEQKYYMTCLPGFIDRFGSHLGEGVAELLEKVGENYLSIMTTDSPDTVVHGDFRADNFFFRETPAAELETCVVDYQGISRFQGGGVDLAYFLCGNPTDMRRQHERELIRHYHRQLCQYAVEDFGFEQCYDDYRRFSIYGLRIAVYAGVSVIQEERGDQMFIRMAERYSTAAFDLGISDFY